MNFGALKSQISTRAFIDSLSAVALIYVILGIYTGLTSGQTRATMEASLASQTTPLIKAASKPVPMPDPEQMQMQMLGEHQNPHLPPANGLPAAPINGFYKEINEHIIPIISSDKQKPFDVYKRPFNHQSGQPVIALALNGYGLSEKISQNILQTLPAEISLILSPYIENPDDWQQKARAEGHEVWLDLPIENASYPEIDLGPQALLKNTALQYNRDRLLWNLGRFTGYAGISAYTDDVFSTAGPMLKGLFKNIYQYHGLGFLELNPQASDNIENLSLGYNGDYTKTNIIIDDTPDTLEESFRELEKAATQHGIAIGVLHAYPTSIKKTVEWIATLKEKGFTIAPISAAADIIPHD